MPAGGRGNASDKGKDRGCSPCCTKTAAEESPPLQPAPKTLYTGNVMKPTQGTLPSSKAGFLVSFLVDARGGAMTGHRHWGMRVIIPPAAVQQPTRINCRYQQLTSLPFPPPFMEREALASRVIEVSPSGETFRSPVLIEIPHFASNAGAEREIIVLRSDDGETWYEHVSDEVENGEIYQDVVTSVVMKDSDLERIYDVLEVTKGRIIRILTSKFPKYFAVLTRVREEVKSVGPDGGKVVLLHEPRLRATFPKNALYKKIKVGLQVQSLKPELVQAAFGRSVEVSKMIAVEPRKRKFHQPIFVSIPLPCSPSKINPSTSIRLLCSVTGATDKAVWADLTGTTPLELCKDVVHFSTKVSAIFWILVIHDKQRDPESALTLASRLYEESILIPYLARFSIFYRENFPRAWVNTIRVYCMTDDKAEKVIKSLQGFRPLAISGDVEVSHTSSISVKLSGNVIQLRQDPFTGELLAVSSIRTSEVKEPFVFKAFEDNSMTILVQPKDLEKPLSGCLSFGRRLDNISATQQLPLCEMRFDVSGGDTNFVIKEDMTFETLDAGVNGHTPDIIDSPPPMPTFRTIEEEDPYEKIEIKKNKDGPAEIKKPQDTQKQSKEQPNEKKEKQQAVKKLEEKETSKSKQTSKTSTTITVNQSTKIGQEKTVEKKDLKSEILPVKEKKPQTQPQYLCIHGKKMSDPCNICDEELRSFERCASIVPQVDTSKGKEKDKQINNEERTQMKTEITDKTDSKTESSKKTKEEQIDSSTDNQKSLDRRSSKKSNETKGDSLEQSLKKEEKNIEVEKVESKNEKTKKTTETCPPCDDNQKSLSRKETEAAETISKEIIKESNKDVEHPSVIKQEEQIDKSVKDNSAGIKKPEETHFESGCEAKAEETHKTSEESDGKKEKKKGKKASDVKELKDADEHVDVSKEVFHNLDTGVKLCIHDLSIKDPCQICDDNQVKEPLKKSTNESEGKIQKKSNDVDVVNVQEKTERKKGSKKKDVQSLSNQLCIHDVTIADPCGGCENSEAVPQSHTTDSLQRVGESKTKNEIKSNDEYETTAFEKKEIDISEKGVRGMKTTQEIKESDSYKKDSPKKRDSSKSRKKTQEFKTSDLDQLRDEFAKKQGVKEIKDISKSQSKNKQADTHISQLEEKTVSPNVPANKTTANKETVDTTEQDTLQNHLPTKEERKKKGRKSKEIQENESLYEPVGKGNETISLEVVKNQNNDDELFNEEKKLEDANKNEISEEKERTGISSIADDFKDFSSLKRKKKEKSVKTEPVIENIQIGEFDQSNQTKDNVVLHDADFQRKDDVIGFDININNDDKNPFVTEEEFEEIEVSKEKDKTNEQESPVTINPPPLPARRKHSKQLSSSDSAQNVSVSSEHKKKKTSFIKEWQNDLKEFFSLGKKKKKDISISRGSSSKPSDNDSRQGDFNKYDKDHEASKEQNISKGKNDRLSSFPDAENKDGELKTEEKSPENEEVYGYTKDPSFNDVDADKAAATENEQISSKGDGMQEAAAVDESIERRKKKRRDRRKTNSESSCTKVEIPAYQADDKVSSNTCVEQGLESNENEGENDYNRTDRRASKKPDDKTPVKNQPNSVNNDAQEDPSTQAERQTKKKGKKAPIEAADAECKMDENTLAIGGKPKVIVPSPQGIPRPRPINKRDTNRDSMLSDDGVFFEDTLKTERTGSLEETEEFRKAVESFDQIYLLESGNQSPEITSSRSSTLSKKLAKCNEDPKPEASPTVQWKRLKTGRSFDATETSSSETQSHSQVTEFSSQTSDSKRSEMKFEHQDSSNFSESKSESSTVKTRKSSKETTEDMRIKTTTDHFKQEDGFEAENHFQSDLPQSKFQSQSQSYQSSTVEEKQSSKKVLKNGMSIESTESSEQQYSASEKIQMQESLQVYEKNRKNQEHKLETSEVSKSSKNILEKGTSIESTESSEQRSSASEKIQKQESLEYYENRINQEQRLESSQVAKPSKSSKKNKKNRQSTEVEEKNIRNSEETKSQEINVSSSKVSSDEPTETGNKKIKKGKSIDLPEKVDEGTAMSVKSSTSVESPITESTLMENQENNGQDRGPTKGESKKSSKRNKNGKSMDLQENSNESPAMSLKSNISVESPQTGSNLMQTESSNNVPVQEPTKSESKKSSKKVKKGKSLDLEEKKAESPSMSVKSEMSSNSSNLELRKSSGNSSKHDSWIEIEQAYEGSLPVPVLVKPEVSNVIQTSSDVKKSSKKNKKGKSIDLPESDDFQVNKLETMSPMGKQDTISNEENLAMETERSRKISILGQSYVDTNQNANDSSNFHEEVIQEATTWKKESKGFLSDEEREELEKENALVKAIREFQAQSSNETTQSEESSHVLSDVDFSDEVKYSELEKQIIQKSRDAQDTIKTALDDMEKTSPSLQNRHGKQETVRVQKHSLSIQDGVLVEQTTTERFSQPSDSLESQSDSCTIDPDSLKNVDGLAKQRKGSSRFSKRQGSKSKSPGLGNQSSFSGPDDLAEDEETMNNTDLTTRLEETNVRMKKLSEVFNVMCDDPRVEPSQEMEEDETVLTEVNAPAFEVDGRQTSFHPLTRTTQIIRKECPLDEVIGTMIQKPENLSSSSQFSSSVENSPLMYRAVVVHQSREENNPSSPLMYRAVVTQRHEEREEFQEEDLL